MLYPSMSDLLQKVNNRYLLVNITAKRARDLAQEAEDQEIPLKGKPVRMALSDIMEGRIIVEDSEDVL